MAASQLEFSEVTKIYHSSRGQVVALRNFSLSVAVREFVAIVGVSGCGKSTLLNLAAGFEFPTQGTVSFNGRTISAPGAERLMMFQDHALFPWLNVAQNVAFGLRSLHLKSPEIRARTAECLELVGLAACEKAAIHELSGGMRQRTALARALALNPQVLLFDEPFSQLDALTRERLYANLQEVLDRQPKTALFVTHNTREAATLADRVVVMSPSPGAVQAIIPVALPRPRDFYDPEVSRLARHLLHELRTGSQEAV